MNLLITGISGYAGKVLAEKLGADNKIYAIGRADPALNQIKFFKGDISNKASLTKIANSININFDAVVHLAAYVPRVKDGDDLGQSVSVNVIGTKNILEVFDGRFDKFVMGSSAEVYDLSSTNGLIKESHALGPKTYYGTTKLASEFMTLAYGHKNNTPVIILRFSVMYGGYDPIERALPNFIQKALLGADIDLFAGATLRDYVHQDDVAQSIVCALDSVRANGVYNIGTGNGVSIENAATEIKKLTNSSSKIVEHEGIVRDVILDIERARKDLGYEPNINFLDGLRDMISSYVER